jgi:uncharacterized protein involved in exopolysaccharide biosynthesis
MQNNINNQDEISLKDIILKIQNLVNYLKSKWRLIFLIGFIGAILGLCYSFIKKPVYKTNLTFVLEEKGEGGLGVYAGIASQFGFSIGSEGGGVFTGDNIIELMKSRLMIEKTLLSEVNISNKKDLLINHYIRFNKLDEKWAKIEKMKDIKFIVGVPRERYTIKQDSILWKIYEKISGSNLTVEKIDKKLSIISVNVNSTNELFSKLFTEQLVKNVSEFYVETKTQKSRANVKLIQNRTDSVKRELDNAMSGYAREKDQNQNLIRMQGQLSSLKKQTDIQVLTAMYPEMIKNLELAKLNLMRDEPLIQVIDTPILPLEKEKLGKVKGMILGAFVFGFLTVIFLLIKRMFKDININS